MTAPGFCSTDAFCHIAKATGYACGTAAASCVIVLTATIVSATVLGLLAWDGFFIYSIGAQAPLHLLWAIPVTLAFIAIDLMIIVKIAQIAARLIAALFNIVVHCGGKSLQHCRSINLS